jgi:hypothetical protein
VLPFEHGTVGRKRLADRDPDAIAAAQLRRRDAARRAVRRDPPHAGRQPADRAFQRLGDPPLQALREIASRQQEADEHRQRVEVRLGAERPVRVERGARARDERDRDAERRRQIHPDAAVAQASPGLAEHRRGREQDDRDAEQPARPQQQTGEVRRQGAGLGEVRRVPRTS